MDNLDQIKRERSRFTELIAAQPNYFGNLGDKAGPVVTKIIAHTGYEEISCLGFDPAQERLVATVNIKRPVGYRGTFECHSSREYVRFYLDEGCGWQDQGIAVFNVRDIPTTKDCRGDATKPLTHAASITIDPKRKPCKTPQLPRVRAILSWQDMPPEDEPSWKPVWGDVKEAHIQVAKGEWTLQDLIDDLKPQLPGGLELPAQWLPAQQKPVLEPAVLSATFEKLAQGYVHKADDKTAVEPHRFAAPELGLAVAGGLDKLLKTSIAEQWNEMNLDLGKAVAEYAKTEGNTDYEEVECLALDPNREELVATFRVKRPTGYLGNLCEEGSKEYIAFYADWDDACGDWEHLGTLALDVHDIANIPSGGLHYAMFLPVDLKFHRRPCDRPKVGRVRAVISWNSPPAGAEDPPRWGNALDAHVLIPHGESVDPDEVRPMFDRIGGIRTRDIDDVTGLTGPDAAFLNGRPADALARPCPFGRRVLVQGPPFTEPSTGGRLRYRIQVRRPGDAWSSLVNTMRIAPLVGPVYDKRPVPGTDLYTYESIQRNPGMVLGWWESQGDELWEVKLEIAGYGEVIQTVQLKNSGIKAREIHIDAGGDCGKFTIGQELTGNFVAQDDYLGTYSLGTTPFAAPLGQLTPLRGNVSTPDAPGSVWSLKTSDMASCGYVVNLSVSDRAILDSIGVHHHASAAVGFCLLEEGMLKKE